MTDQSHENSPNFIEMDTNKLKRFFVKHKTEIIFGAALAVSVTINFVRTSLPKIADANWYALTHEDVEYFNGLLEHDQEFQKF